MTATIVSTFLFRRPVLRDIYLTHGDVLAGSFQIALRRSKPDDELGTRAGTLRKRGAISSNSMHEQSPFVSVRIFW